MLIELKVRNFAIIDKIDVEFQTGFNVLSGETGSGKSLMLKSLALLMGGKSSPDTIKSGESQATVEGAFELSDRSDIHQILEALGLDTPEKLLVVRRIISKDGKNRVYINGSLATLTQLKDIVCPLIEVTGRSTDDGEPLSPLIEMTSQHENRNLQSKAYHLDLIDQYLGLFPKRQELSALVSDIAELKQEIQELESKSMEKAQRLDFLSFQRDEISSVKLSPGDEVDLKNRADILRNSEKLRGFSNSAEAVLYSDDESALVRLHRVIQEAGEFVKLDGRIKELVENLSQAKTLIEESTYELRNFSKGFESNDDELADAESKLSELRKLQKKYGTSVDDILMTLKSIESEIENLENSEVLIEDQRKQLTKLEGEALKIAKNLHNKRVKGTNTLLTSVQAELKDLNMKGLIFGVTLEECELNSSGITNAEFTIQSTKTDTPRALAKFASGGELSRILLSLKRVIGLSDRPRTYLFDEVDAGVSGVTAEKVGRKLKSISKGQQVICVTHLPQVAAFADSHFVINKTAEKDKVQMSVDALVKKARIEEVARMISGEKITKTSLAHAKELIEQAQ